MKHNNKHIKHTLENKKTNDYYFISQIKKNNQKMNRGKNSDSFHRTDTDTIFPDNPQASYEERHKARKTLNALKKFTNELVIM